MPAPELDPTTSTPSESPCREKGFATLRSYAPIGEGRTIAPVAMTVPSTAYTTSKLGCWHASRWEVQLAELGDDAR